MKTEQPKKTSHKLDFIEQMEELLLMNVLLPGERLPAERELAKQMGVSRPLIHEGLLELGARGLISIRPRHGWIVNDFAKDGSLNLLNSLYKFSSSPMAEQIDSDLEEVRCIILTESLKKYFLRCKTQTGKKADLTDKLIRLITPVKTEKSTTSGMQAITERDFLFYRCIIEAGGNIVFVLLFNSAKELYHKKLESFFSRSPEIQMQVAEMKLKLIEAIKTGKEKKALELIKRMTSYSTYEIHAKNAAVKTL